MLGRGTLAAGVTVVKVTEFDYSVPTLVVAGSRVARGRRTHPSTPVAEQSGVAHAPGGGSGKARRARGVATQPVRPVSVQSGGAKAFRLPGSVSRGGGSTQMPSTRNPQSGAAGGKPGGLGGEGGAGGGVGGAGDQGGEGGEGGGEGGGRPPP